jgi:dihydropteroate synthase
MHMQGTPATMQAAPHYGDVVAEVRAYLRSARRRSKRRAWRAATSCSIRASVRQDARAQRRSCSGPARHAALGYPVLAGLSRKRTHRRDHRAPVDEAPAGSVAAALLAVQNGATFVRVHDVKETVDAMKIWMAFQ